MSRWAAPSSASQTGPSSDDSCNLSERDLGIFVQCGAWYQADPKAKQSDKSRDPRWGVTSGARGWRQDDAGSGEWRIIISRASKGKSEQERSRADEWTKWIYYIQVGLVSSPSPVCPTMPL